MSEGKRGIYYLRGLRKSFDGHHVLNGIDLDLHRGETLASSVPQERGKACS